MSPTTSSTGPAALTWTKSSYSGNDDADCVEVALEWFKSSYSSNDGPDCVEVAIAPTAPTVHVRDSKNKNGARLTVTDAAWTEFVAFTTTR
ncbi:toxin [Streptomyces aureoverticillatus]|nr:toxin [Streptomyces aureoverticillatus]